MRIILRLLPPVLLIMILLLFPPVAFASASDGLLLWFNVLLPTLFPYMIASSLLMSVLMDRQKNHKISPCFALTGILCGYPMGAKLCSDLIQYGQISVTTAQFFLPLCNLAGPAFIVNYVMEQSLHMRSRRLHFLLCIYLPILFYALLSYRKIKRNQFDSLSQSQLPIQKKINLDECIMNSFSAITRLGGYVILFSILAGLLLHLFEFTRFSCPVLLIGILEITNGINLLTDSTLSVQEKILSAVLLINFGGLSCIFQTNSMIRGSGLSIKSYIISKLIMTGLSFLLFLLLF